MKLVSRVQLSPRAKVSAVAGAVCLQVALPAVAMLTQAPPARFAFSMYTGQGTVEVEILDADGRSLPFEPNELISGFRPGIDWYDHLPPFLCQKVPGAHTVTVTQKGHESRLTCD